MHMAEGKRQVATSVAVDDDDVATFRKLQDLGCGTGNQTDAKEQEKIEKVLENREKEVLNQFVNISAVVQSMIEAINEKIPDPRKWNRRLKATLFIKKFNEAVS